ncbi:transmembrane anchored protein [Rhizobium ruizarguesonis]|nr:transmembrane anchored protein [Rhizobium ruizarguesonis]TAZ38477.1 transmembrane anchored protein [Rhizobium ruizarguesonis]
MKTVIAIVLLSFAIPSISAAGNCQTSSDRASDGSRCGDRAADQRDGGN